MRISATRKTSPESRKKLRELILYIADRLDGDVNFGAIKLNKIILKADQLAYVRTGKSITDTPYMKLEQGFVPYHMKPILEEMIEANEIVIRKRQNYQYIQHRVVPLRDADLKLFSANDIALVEEVIDECIGLTGSAMSHQSHGTAWKVAAMREVVPYAAFLLSDDQTVSETDIDQAFGLIDQHGWDVSA